MSAGLADGKISVKRLHALGVRSVLAERPNDALIWMTVDGSPLERPEAETSEDRGSIHVSNVPRADTPLSSGWLCSVVALLPEQASRWAPPLDVQRISSEQTAVSVAIAHRRRLTPLVGTHQVIVVADRWSGTPDMLWACQALGDHVLIRRKSTCTRFRKPVCRFPPGRPPVAGPRLQGTRPATRGDPAAGGKPRIRKADGHG
jgi:hypothetical protein